MKANELKNKHNHALTQWLKVGIFSLLMLAPLFACISQWLYATLNKNAYQSYSDKSEIKLKLIGSNSESIVGQQYMISLKEGNNYSQNIFFDSTTIDFEEFLGQTLPYNPTGFRFYPNNTQIRLIDVNLNIYNYELTDAQRQYLNGQSFVYKSGNLIENNQPVNFYQILYTVGSLDNAFYYGVEKMTESDLFNWTQNTALYTGIKGMTNNLEIGTPAIAILITYWTILTIAYVIIDILITGFTWITHLIVRND